MKKLISLVVVSLFILSCGITNVPNNVADFFKDEKTSYDMSLKIIVLIEENVMALSQAKSVYFATNLTSKKKLEYFNTLEKKITENHKKLMSDEVHAYFGGEITSEHKKYVFRVLQYYSKYVSYEYPSFNHAYDTLKTRAKDKKAAKMI